MSQRVKQIVNSCVVIACALLSAASCGTPPGSSGTANSEPLVKTEPAKPPSDKGDQVVTGGDLAFLSDAAPGGLAEVELGQLAAKQATSAGVRQFAERMVADHTKAGADLKALAQQKKVMLPMEANPKDKQEMDKLSKLKGADFDREYVTAMVAAHERDVKAFESEANGAVDADVKAFAAKTLPTLKEHLRMINDLAGKMGAPPKP